jgi:colicin import membrane protein
MGSWSFWRPDASAPQPLGIEATLVEMPAPRRAPVRPRAPAPTPDPAPPAAPAPEPRVLTTPTPRATQRLDPPPAAKPAAAVPTPAPKPKDDASEEAREREAALRASIAAEERVAAIRGSAAAASWYDSLRAHIERQWRRPATARAGLRCVVLVDQVPGGEVINARITECNGDEAVRQSIETAVLRASPLPEPPDPALFERRLELVFAPGD